jgi:hypothetical protein
MILEYIPSSYGLNSDFYYKNKLDDISSQSVNIIWNNNIYDIGIIFKRSEATGKYCFQIYYSINNNVIRKIFNPVSYYTKEDRDKAAYEKVTRFVAEELNL